jgi:acetoin utilization deacetylase AcuC-like enzyme
MKVYYSDSHRIHNPPFEILDGGEKSPSYEIPERMDSILQSLRKSSWAEIVPPKDFGLEPILDVHDNDYIEFLRTAFDLWTNETANYEHSALTPATFPPGGMRRIPKSVLGKAGYYMMDLSAPIGAGTFEAALQSANCALSGAQELQSGREAVFSLCRPPGHHAGKANCGGYCYLNNAAIAANWLSKFGNVAILDIDYHAGNGTQEIFFERDDVLTISIHADPEYEYPYYAGYPDEIGRGAGLGFHRNFPMSFGATDNLYVKVLSEALNIISDFDPSYFVVSAGMDLCAGDPLGKFEISIDGVRKIGQLIAGLKMPSLVVMEGGYHLITLGENVTALLSAFEQGS